MSKVGPEQLPSGDESKTREFEKKPSLLRLFVVRHGRSKYLERDSVKRKGEWNPDINDLTPQGEKEVLESAEDIAREIDPQKNIVVFLSSPRARALRTKEIIENHLKGRGVEIYNGGDPVVDMLRSGGDDSPTTGEGNMVKFSDKRGFLNYDIDNEGEEITTGARFKKFLSFFNAIDSDKLLESINRPGNKFHGKMPVFISITHREVLHSYDREDNKTSFLGEAFPEDPSMRISRGQWMKLDFNLEHPGNLSVTTPSGVDSSHRKETRELHFDEASGEITTVKAGDTTSRTKSH
ncbi:MAG: histidine phosphatase family protein [Candidatus Yanofskybacteria bacterium]|nr:histidine phosphatase family protein [Candidatus Yanofskybacteria bacterium]